MLVIEVATEATDEVVDAIGRMVPLLSSSAPKPSRADLAEIVTCPSTTLFVARDGEGGPIVGTLTLAIFRIPTAVRAWIEDVIVAEEARGQRGGELLTMAALSEAEKQGARTVDLTSRPSREAANWIYQKVGFARRETNVYRYELGG